MRLLPLLAWLLLAAVAIVTIAPIGFRPVSSFSPNVERFVTFGAVGFVFALAYPRRLLLIIAVVFGAAISLELAQLFAAGRHGTLRDLGIKLLGGGLGIAAAVLARRVWERLAAGRAT